MEHFETLMPAEGFVHYPRLLHNQSHKQVLNVDTRGYHTGQGNPTDTTLVYFIGVLSTCIPIMVVIDNLSRISPNHLNSAPPIKITKNSDQHARISMQQAYFHQLAVITGVSASDTINCDRADEIGKEVQNQVVSKSYAELSMKRSGKVLPLSAMTSTVNVR